MKNPRQKQFKIRLWETDSAAHALVKKVKEHLSPFCYSQVNEHAKIAPDQIPQECQEEYQRILQGQLGASIGALMQDLTVSVEEDYKHDR